MNQDEKNYSGQLPDPDDILAEIAEKEAEAKQKETTTEFPLPMPEATPFPEEEPEKGGFFRLRRKRRRKREEPVLLTSFHDDSVLQSSFAEAAESLQNSADNSVDDTREVVTVSYQASEADAVDDDTREVFTEKEDTEITQIVTLSEEEDVLPEEPDNNHQMVLEGFEETEEPEVPDAEERLRRVRQEKIEDFSQKREKLQEEARQNETLDSGSEEVIEPEKEDTEETSGPVLFEKTTELRPEDKNQLSERLHTLAKRAGLSLFLSVVAEMVLFFLTILSSVFTANPTVYLAVHLVAFVTLIALNGRVLCKGVAELFSGNSGFASGMALSAIFTLIHTASQFINTVGIVEGTTPLLTAVSGFGILSLSIVKRLETDRALRNFEIAVKDEREKLVMKLIEDPEKAEEIGRPAVAMGMPKVSYFRRTKTTADFLANASDDNLFRSQMRWFMPVTVILSFAVALVYFVLNGLASWMVSLTILCTALAVSVPAGAVLAVQVALSASARHLAASGTALMGGETVRQFGTANALALDATDLFPEKSVLLHGIKTFAGTRIDDAILDAASVCIRAGGPLSHVFRRMIQNKVDMLHEVDTLVYEQDMGLSGWVSGRRVLIGNRKLLENHGIDIPSLDYEDRYAKNDRKLVYLSIAGELSAMFVVSYTADPVIKRLLTALNKRHVTLLIRTCDQNISEPLLTSVFGIDGYYVEMLNAPAGRSYESIIEGVTEVEPATVVSVSSHRPMIAALTACSKLRLCVTLFTVLQVVAAIFALVLVAYISFFTENVMSASFATEFLIITSILFTVASRLIGKN